MKSLFTILLFVLPLSAHAVSPWIEVTRKSGKANSTCLIVNDHLTLAIQNKAGKRFFATADLDIDEDYLKSVIEGARSEKTSIALHIMAADPSIRMEVGINDWDNLLLFSDGGRMETRKGPRSDELRQLINDTCEAEYANLIAESPEAKL